MNPVLRGSAAHVVVDSLDDPQLTRDDEHHLRRVLRIRERDEITVTDGRGRWAPARLTSAGVQVIGEIQVERRRVAARTVVCAIPKGDRVDTVVQKLTELGLDRILFVRTQRTVVQWDDERAARQLQRLRRVAREAVMQSRRVHLPEVDVCSWADAVALPHVALADPAGTAFPSDVETVVIGPEGGFTDDERADCSGIVKLADHVLRVETAAIAAGVLLMYRGGGADTG